MKKNKLLTPFVKWVGGKRQLVNEITSLLPKKINKYCEPFIGGGAILFHLQPKEAIINDYNSELINVYNVIKNNLEDLILDLKKHQNNEEYFYKLRSLDRSIEFNNLNNIERASRIIYLNKTCYNGLYRVNNSGEFNSPFGKYKNPNIVNEPVLKAVNIYLNKNNISIYNGDYLNVLNIINRETFVYLDPPYHPLSDSSNFTGYIQGGWNADDQVKLKEACDMLTSKNIKFLLSNSYCDFIVDLYKDYQINRVKATRNINSDSNKRGEIDEVLIRNYE